MAVVAPPLQPRYSFPSPSQYLRVNSESKSSPNRSSSSKNSEAKPSSSNTAVFRDGLRVTDAETMEIVSMVLVGKVNKTLVSLINKVGATAVGLSGMDGKLLIASPKSSDLGFVGEFARVDPTVIRSLVDSGHIPVVTSVAADESGQPYNINADTILRVTIGNSSSRTNHFDKG
ncbi:acetylglutamate kinase [Trifolium repens]|nr:acetylglutamate kinase [Trifolium repens]